MDETGERRTRKQGATELRRSRVYPALLHLRAALRRQTSVDRTLPAWAKRVLRSLDISAP